MLSINKQILLDIFIISLILFVGYSLKYENIRPSGSYLILYGITLINWIVLSVYHGKYDHFSNMDRSLYLKSSLWVAAYSLFFTTLMISIVGIISISRLFLLSTLIFLFLKEVVLGLLFLTEQNHDAIPLSENDRREQFKDLVSIKYMLPSLVWLVAIFIFMVWLKTSRVYYYEGLEQILLVLFGSWAISTGITYRYNRNIQHNIYYFISPYLKSGILMLLLVSIFYFFFRLEPLSRFLLFGTVIVHTLFEVLMFSMVFLMRNLEDTDKQELQDTSTLVPKENLLFHSRNESSNSLKYNLGDILKDAVRDESWITMLTTRFEKSEFEKDDVSILSTQSIFNIDILEPSSLWILLNLEKVNNQRRINQYLLSSYKKIKAGGWITGSYTALEDEWLRIRSKMPKIIFLLLYPGNFTIHRILPKIPYLKYIYFTLTKGKNRKLSRAEMMGRLAYCGFKIVDETTHDSSSYFIAQKTHHPSQEPNPSYGMVIQLERIGYKGKRIKIYKFRTMHPYSEFIQKEVFEQNDLDESGKLKNDFRLTSWGKILRKIWIDELPQLLNWLRGDVDLVGVRALSEHYYSLYPRELQELRIKFKPGLVPPYYADLPKNFKEIIESEEKYLLQKQEHPFKTDFVYFWKVFYNIAIKGARSQ